MPSLPADAADESTDRPSAAPWWEPPSDELPAIVPICEVVAANDHVALSVVGVHVYRSGVEFRIDRRVRRAGMTQGEWAPLAAAATHDVYSPAELRPDRLRYGVDLPGATPLVVDRYRPFDPPVPSDNDGIRLARGGGGGGGDDHQLAYLDSLWLWPGAPASDLDLVVAWPAVGLGEARLTLDGRALRRAASSTRPVWS